MRVLAVVQGGEATGRRLAPAAVGLALRGHRVIWAGRPPAAAAAELTLIERRRDLWGADAEVVVSDWGRPWKPALEGWQARALCQVLALRREEVRRWGWLEHSAWHSLHPQGLVEPEEAEAFRGDALGLELARLALWSDQPPADRPDPAHPDTEILERACERSLARHRSRAPRPAVFVDRDGTLVREVGYLADPGDLELLPGVPEALRGLKAAGHPVVVISNQSGVERGLFPIERVYAAMARLRRLLRAEGVELDGIYFCPHRPEAGCACRKPSGGLLERAAEDLNLSLGNSVMVGDKRLDAETGQRAGGRGVLVRTGYGREEEQRAGDAARPPDAVCDDLLAAAGWILARSA